MFRLLKNEKTLLMTNEDMFTKISLILSRIQKEVLEDGDINVSDVLDAFNKIKEATLIKGCTVMSNDNTDIPQATAKEYMSDLKCQNLIDPWSLFKKLNTFWKSNDQVNEHDAIKFVNKANVLMVLPDHFNDPKMADIQIAKLLFSAKSHQLYELVLEDTLENSHAIIKEVQFPGFKVSKISWNDVEGTMQTKYKPLHLKRDEKYNLQLFLGYLKLLTNSRDELSLAKVICGAGGILNHNAFNALKKESLQTKMPMYQV